MCWRKGKKPLKQLPQQGKKRARKTTQKNYPEKLPKKTTQKISDIQTRIVDYLRHNPRANRGAIATHIKDITEDGIKYHLKALQEKGIIKRIGPDKGGYWKVLSEDIEK